VGLAALLQVVRRARTPAEVTVSGGRAFHRLLVEAHLPDVLPARLGDQGPASAARPGPAVPVAPAAEPGWLAQGRLVTLRLAGQGDVPVFARWASDAALDHLVGSELLYVCRHRRDEPKAVARVIGRDPTALTALVEPRDEPGRAVGYVRLYHVRLGDGLAFLETAMAEREYHRAGYGVEATRLLLAYAVDALELNRIEAKVYAYNTASCNALRRRGFEEEGRLHEARAVGGGRADVLVFALYGDEMRRRRLHDPLPSMGLWTG
jgi:RimJ/RimL family protein N-acetyltransferase